MLFFLLCLIKETKKQSWLEVFVMQTANRAPMPWHFELVQGLSMSYREMHFKQLSLEHLKFIEKKCFRYISQQIQVVFLQLVSSCSSYEMNMDWVVEQCYRPWDHTVLHCSEYIGRIWRNAFILYFHFFIDTWLSLVITVLLTIFSTFITFDYYWFITVLLASQT